MLAACGRMGFEPYPMVACEDVTASDSFVWTVNEHCYTRHDLALPLPSAQAACTSIGGHLATITDADENGAIATRVAQPARLGFIDATGWIWVTDEPAPFANWAAGQPVACATGTTTALMDADGTWITGCYSTDSYPYLCEIEPWLTRPEDGHRYRILWKPDDWFGASTSCEALGGHLATLTSFEEVAFVSQIITVNVWLGATSQTGTFGWATNEPFGAYAAWASGEPNVVGPACLATTHEQVWFDVDCPATYRALCEID